MHDAFRMTYGGKLYLSPLTKLENALDIGTGTGIWAIDLGGFLCANNCQMPEDVHLQKSPQPMRTLNVK